MRQVAAAGRTMVGWVAVLALTAAVGWVWWGLLPPWTAPDEPGHYLYAWQLAGLAGSRSAQESAIADSLTAHDWWRYNGRQQPAQLLERFADDPVLAASGDQTIGEPHLYYALPAFWLRQTSAGTGGDPAVHLRLMRLQSWLLHLLATASSLLLARIVWPGRADRVWGMGLLVGLWPMAGFMGAGFNNDALGLFGAAAAFTLVMAAWLDGRTILWLAALLVVGLSPFILDIGLLYLWPLAAVLAGLQLLARRPRLWPAFLIFLLAALALFLPDPRWAAGWRSPATAERTRTNGVLALAPAGSDQGGQTTSIVQILSGKDVLALRNQPLALEVRVLGEPGSQALVVVADQAHASLLTCEPSENCTGQFTPDPLATHLRVEASSADGIRLQMALRNDEGRDLLFNGDGSQPDRVGRLLFRQLERWLPVPAGFFGRLGWDNAWDAPSQLRYAVFALFTGAGFWGYFGWLSRALPAPLYLLLAALTLAAVTGLVGGLPSRLRRRRAGAPSREDQAVLASVLALFFILLQTWLPMVGQAWQPQGRYLLPALAPVALLFLVGWEAIWPASRKRWFLPALAGGLLALNLASWWVILP